jgi:SNF2 family DNA or RNA helicase
MLPSFVRKKPAATVKTQQDKWPHPTSDRHFVRATDDGSIVIDLVQAGSKDDIRTARVIGASRGELRRYQMDGIHFLTKQGRAILADEQGVGKTVQALIAARHLVPAGGKGRILIVAPKSAAGTWVYEARKWLDEEVRSYQGTVRSYDVLDKAPIVITNYSLMKEVFERHPHWTLIIFDEAHKLRGWRGNRSQKGTYKALSNGSASYKFFLTGTPVFSNAGDLWPLLKQIDPDKFGGYWPFLERWTYLEKGHFGWTIIGNKNPRKLNRGLKNEGYMLRRLKKDVLEELPPKTRMEWILEMTPKQKRDYLRLVKEFEIEISDERTLAVPNKVALLMRLRQLLVAPRVLGLDYDGAAIESLREELAESNDAALVFTPFAKALPVLQEALAKTGRPTRIVRGGMSPEQLADAIHWFQTTGGQREPVLLTSLLMGTGWTATRATLGYFLQYDWSPSNNFQAEDRLHRYGQQHATTIKYAMHKGTIDEHVMDILNGKLTVQKAILDPEKFLLGKLAGR